MKVGKNIEDEKFRLEMELKRINDIEEKERLIQKQKFMQGLEKAQNPNYGYAQSVNEKITNSEYEKEAKITHENPILGNIFKSVIMMCIIIQTITICAFAYWMIKILGA